LQASIKEIQSPWVAEGVFKIDCGAEGFSAEHRAWLTQDALDNALVASADKSASAVSVERRNGALIVALGGRKVATADCNSAKAEGMTPEQLAAKWADGIRSFLNSDQAAGYIASLKSPNPLQADVAVVERRLFAQPAPRCLRFHQRNQQRNLPSRVTKSKLKSLKMWFSAIT